jgi:putative SOS response-associated peptidase YedK
MCARYTLTRSELGEVVKLLGADVDHSARQIHLPRFNVGSAQRCVIAINGDGLDGATLSPRPVLTAAVWGVHLGGHMVVNLRSETARRRPGFQRCVVLTDGFYEWTGEKGHKCPLWFHRPDGGLLFFAGLADDAGTFVIVTALAAGPVLEVHDQAPVMFTATKARTWLAKGGPPKSAAVKLVGVEVSLRANSVANDDAGLLEPAAGG